MKKNFGIFVILMLCFSFVNAGQEYINTDIDGKQLEAIVVDLSSEYKIVTSLSYQGDSLEDLVENVGGVSGVNGAYFCPDDYGHCDGNSTDTYRVYEGRVDEEYGKDLGGRGLFGFDSVGDSLFILNNRGYVDGINREYNSDKFGEVEYGLANFPVLLLEGDNVTSESASIIENEEKMQDVGTKTFICSTRTDQEVMMGNVSNVNVWSLATFLEDNTECYNAINLDAGGSLGMIYDNETKRSPARDIMDAFVVVKETDYKEETNQETKNLGDYNIRHGNVYYNQDVIEYANYENFEYVDDDYGKDNQYVYYKGEPLRISWGEDPQTVQEGYSVEWADPRTFEKISDEKYKDKNYVYKNGEALKGEDPGDYKQSGEDETNDLTNSQKQIIQKLIKKIDSIVAEKASNEQEKKQLYKKIAEQINEIKEDYPKQERLILKHVINLCIERYHDI